MKKLSTLTLTLALISITTTESMGANKTCEACARKMERCDKRAHEKNRDLNSGVVDRVCASNYYDCIRIARVKCN